MNYQHVCCQISIDNTNHIWPTDSWLTALTLSQQLELFHSGSLIIWLTDNQPLTYFLVPASLA